ncbi:MAG: sensor histidine kinase [Saprospiraceae bacterium]
MDSTSPNSFGRWARAYSLLSSPMIRHATFWAVIFILLILLEGTRYGALFALTNEFINTFFYVTIIYFNLYYLIPNYLNKKQFLTYLILLVLASAIITPIKILVFYLKFSGKPELQLGLLENQFGYFLTIFLAASLGTVVKISNDWVQQLKERQDLERQTMQSELRFLRSQINPHFLFNTLNSLYALTLKKSDLAPEIVLKLSEMMRYMLYECNEKRVLLSKEISYLQNYIDLERLRQGNQVKIDFEASGDIGEQTIAPLLFIPFMENSFKHGIMNNLEKDSFVHIRIAVNGRALHFFIENSKPRQRPIRDPNRPSGGIGLSNIHRRLNLLYPKHYDLRINDTPNTYAVFLDLELD